MAQILIDGGAVIDAETPKGLTPFESTSDVGIRRVLMAAGAKGLRQTEGEPYDLDQEAVPFATIDAQRGQIGIGDDGALWVGSYGGFYRTSDGETTRYAPTNSPATTAIGAAHGSTYIATNQGLFRFHGDNTTTRYTPNNSGLHDQHIVGMTVLNDEVWCIGYERESKAKHVSVFDGKTWRLLEPGKDLPECDVELVMIDSEGRVVVSGGEEDGIYMQEKKSKAWTHEFIAAGPFAPKVYSMLSQDGVDYFGTHMGLFRRTADGFEKMRGGAFSQLGCAGTTLWGATNWDGVFAFEGDDVQEYNDERAGLSLSNVESMAVHDDEIYLVAGGKFLRIRDGEFTDLNA